MKKTKQRIEYIDLAKGFCILLVVFTHANSAFLGEVEYAIEDALKIFRMPLYFFLSGLFFKPYEGYIGFLKRKINKLLIPFLFFHIASCFIVPILNRTSFEWHTLWDILLGYDGSPNVPLWFLICLFWQNQIFYALYKLSVTMKYPVFAISILSVVIGLLGYAMGGTAYNIKAMNIGTAFTTMPFFAVGYLFRCHTDILYPTNWDKWLIPLAVLCFLFTYCLTDGKAEYFINMYQVSAPVLYVSAFSGVLGILFLSKSLIRLPFVSYVGRYSIMILVTHAPFMQRVMPLLFRLNLPYWWITSVSATVIVSLSYILLIPLMKRFLPYVTAQKDVIPI